MTEFNFKEKNYENVLFSSMKNEGPYILDWVSYHLAIGFTHIVVATNDCEDGSDKLLRQLENFGIVTFKNHSGPFPQGVQKHAFLKLQSLEPIQKAKWLMGLDADEYLRIDIGKGTVADLRVAIGEDTQAVSFVAQVFGSAGREELSEEATISANLTCSHPMQANPAPVMALKTFYKNGNFEKLGVHRPMSFTAKNDPNFAWIDADGVSLKTLHQSKISHAAQNGWAFGTALGRINHYALRSLDAFANKWARGVPNSQKLPDAEEMSAAEYWQIHNWNLSENKKILRNLDAMLAIKAHFLKNEKIKKLHNRAFRHHLKIANQIHRKSPEFFSDLANFPSSAIGEREILEICNTEFVPKNKWLVDIRKLEQKIRVTLLLKFYTADVDYSSKVLKDAK